MITRVEIENYRSFLNAAVDLKPFTLVIGPNGGGKTNFLRLFRDLNKFAPKRQQFGKGPNTLTGHQIGYTTHFNLPKSNGKIVLHTQEGTSITADFVPGVGAVVNGPLGSRGTVVIYSPIPDQISQPEKTQPNPKVGPTGAGTTQVLESLRLGEDEERFNLIEQALATYVPEIEKLSIKIPSADHKQIQVKERGIDKPIPADQLSEGSRIILCLLTILYQATKPELILIEDIDRAMHPRLFEQMMQLFQRLVEKEGIQIIATTHNPYLVDYFIDDPASVVIVEKENGNSTLATLEERLAKCGGNLDSPDDLPRGTLWFSGMLGGTPKIYANRKNELPAPTERK